MGLLVLTFEYYQTITIKDKNAEYSTAIRRQPWTAGYIAKRRPAAMVGDRREAVVSVS